MASGEELEREETGNFPSSSGTARTDEEAKVAETQKPLTLAEINGEVVQKEDTTGQKVAGFKIVAGEDSDSIFEDNFQQEDKFEEMEKWSDYGEEEDWGSPHDPYDMAGTETKPEALPLEAIIEENSVIKESPP